ncbi:MAG: PadR family transcriptional regulator [Solirubrobacterales bacterium]
MELNSVAKVILGFLSSEDLSGYDIKLRVDESTRFFWAASYGQIYPELKRLEEEGLVEGSASPQGGRQRTVFRITDKGREALASWIMDTGSTIELRHEGLLKIFFVDALPSGNDRIAVLESMAADHRHQVAELEEVARRFGAGELSCELDDTSVDHPGDPGFVLRFGLDYHRWVVEWCEREVEAARAADRVTGGAGV